ncbi:hypothetical protein RN001_006429 [Aquatica leii]|uniref:Cytosol aminopeptidase n=1 Tax=Aquatica leii TaxID=1421715 RepID=A0AAN7SS90_9COLE|nr:hypothetical protein RN001_006429 [Aquatica leii]
MEAFVSRVDGHIKPGKTFIFWDLDENHTAVGLVGLGKKCKDIDRLECIDPDKEAVRVAAAAGCRALQEAGMSTIMVDDMDDPEAAGEGSTLGMWKFQECKSEQKTPPQICLLVQPYDGSEISVCWEKGVEKANAQNDARRLTDMPSNLMTPTLFATEIERLYRGLDIYVDVHEKDWIASKNMNAFLAVAKGSCESPKFLEITYNRCSGRPMVFVGKGVTFDSGGISIKPSKDMDQMRGDMGGAAACAAALKCIAMLNIRANIKLFIPVCENMPSGNATKPGDIVRAMNGKTIAINNTDAEGRLILADALSFANTFDPIWVMSVATLTGAMQVALGTAATGVFSSSNELYDILQNAGSLTGDRVWRFPLWKHYTDEITKDAAFDVNNIGKGVGGGSCTAAAFLNQFVCKTTPFMHLDIASVSGPATVIPYLYKGMTGRPTRTLIEFVKMQVKPF